MRSIITKIKTKLTQQHNDVEKGKRHQPIGICGILYHMDEVGQITEEEYRFIKGHIRARAKEQQVFFDHQGDATKDDTQFIWKPYEYEARWAFLDSIQKGERDDKV